jgi:hypothetical protein
MLLLFEEEEALGKKKVEKEMSKSDMDSLLLFPPTEGKKALINWSRASLLSAPVVPPTAVAASPLDTSLCNDDDPLAGSCSCCCSDDSRVCAPSLREYLQTGHVVFVVNHCIIASYLKTCKHPLT